MDPTTIPNDRDLATAETAYLRVLAEEFGLDADKADSGLRRDLRRLRGGGVVITCQRCENVWVYGGDSEYYCTCSRCRTTVKVPDR